MPREANASIEEVTRKLLPILRRHGARRAGLFGSVVAGTEKEDSDIDVLVELDADLSLLDVARINRELEEAVGRRVDLVEYRAIKPRIRDSILAQELRIL